MSQTIKHDPEPLGPQRNSARNLTLWAAVTASILAIPFVAMFYTNEVQWTAFDFVFAGVVIFGVGALYEAAARRARGNSLYRWAAALTLLTTFLTIWFQGAVGIIGDGDDGVGLIFLGLLAILFLCALHARFAARGIAQGLFLISGLQAGFAGWAIISAYDQRGGVAAFVMAGMWAVAGALFSRA